MQLLQAVLNVLAAAAATGEDGEPVAAGTAELGPTAGAVGSSCWRTLAGRYRGSMGLTDADEVNITAVGPPGSDTQSTWRTPTAASATSISLLLRTIQSARCQATTGRRWARSTQPRRRVRRWSSASPALAGVARKFVAAARRHAAASPALAVRQPALRRLRAARSIPAARLATTRSPTPRTRARALSIR
jgi:hypothetical protein